MGVPVPNLSLFYNQEGFEEAQELVNKINARKRGSYDIKPKIFEYNPYAHIRELYTQLTNLIGIRGEMFITSRLETIDGINRWYDFYEVEQYEYQDKMFQGEEFRYIEAEISGTEFFDIYDRIKLHQELINLLRKKVPLVDAMQIIQQRVKEVQKDYEVKEITKRLKSQRKI